MQTTIGAVMRTEEHASEIECEGVNRRFNMKREQRGSTRRRSSLTRMDGSVNAAPGCVSIRYEI